MNVIKTSPIPEDVAHAHNVLEWVWRFKPDADFALQTAALGHDIERALPQRKVNRSDFATFDEFKIAHAQNSAKIIREILAEYPLPLEFVEKLSYLVAHHEFGNGQDPELKVLKDADSLSFFEVNLPHYFQRESEEETFLRMQWGYGRLSHRAKQYLKSLCYREKILNTFLNRLQRERENL